MSVGCLSGRTTFAALRARNPEYVVSLAERDSVDTCASIGVELNVATEALLYMDAASAGRPAHLAGFLFCSTPLRSSSSPHVAYFDNLNLLSLIGFAGVLELIGSVLLIVVCYAAGGIHPLGEMAAPTSSAVPQGHFSRRRESGEPAVL